MNTAKQSLNEIQLRLGLCMEGCGRPIMEGGVLCQECNETKLQRQRVQRARKTDKGLCIRHSCRNKVEPGYKTCRACIEKISAGAKKREAKRKKAAKGTSSAPPKKEKGKFKTKKIYQERYDNGLCIQGCGRLRGDSIKCQVCRSKESQRRHIREAKKILEGRCIRDRCQNQPETGNKICKECIAKAKLSRNKHKASGTS